MGVAMKCRPLLVEPPFRLRKPNRTSFHYRATFLRAAWSGTRIIRTPVSSGSPRCFLGDAGLVEEMALGWLPHVSLRMPSI